jgi:hypothetical protein
MAGVTHGVQDKGSFIAACKGRYSDRTGKLKAIQNETDWRIWGSDLLVDCSSSRAAIWVKTEDGENIEGKSAGARGNVTKFLKNWETFRKFGNLLETLGNFGQLRLWENFGISIWEIFQPRRRPRLRSIILALQQGT